MRLLLGAIGWACMLAGLSGIVMCAGRYVDIFREVWGKR